MSDINYKDLFIRAIIFAFIMLAIKLMLGWTPAAHSAEVSSTKSIQELISGRPSTVTEKDRVEQARVEEVQKNMDRVQKQWDFEAKMAEKKAAQKCVYEAVRLRDQWGSKLGMRELQKCYATYGDQTIFYYNAYNNAPNPLNLAPVTIYPIVGKPIFGTMFSY